MKPGRRSWSGIGVSLVRAFPPGELSSGSLAIPRRRFAATTRGDRLQGPMPRSPGRSALRRLVAGMVSVVGCAACGTGNPAKVSPLGDPCLVAASPPVKDTIIAALPGPLRAGGIAGGSIAERFVSAQLADREEWLDCEGRLRPARPSAFRLVGAAPPTLVPAPAGLRGPVIRLLMAGGSADPRDLIDAGADLVITAELAALDYARRRGGLTLVPLAWSTTYGLVVPTGGEFPVALTAGLRQELARDAVEVEARPAEKPVPWDRCPRLPVGGRPRLTGIVVPAGDPVARALAERLVALTPLREQQRVMALPASEWDSVLAAGGATAFVVRLDRSPGSGCEPMPPIPAGATLSPLIEVRPTAILRPGTPAFLVRGDGTIRVLPAIP